MAVYAKIKKRLGIFKLDVEFGSDNGTLGLLGASGCGKSMTLKCIAGIIRPDEGLIKVNDQVLFDSKRGIDLKPQERRVGLMFQNYALFPNMTLRENICSELRHSSRSSETGRNFEELTEILYLKGLEEHYPCQLSGGQQQRAALARILASGPQLIMLDEPLSALDSYLRWQVEQELSLALASFCGTTLYVSHNRDEVFRMCRKICVINEGRSEKVCTAEELFNAPSSFSAAMLSGCRNYSRIVRINEKRVNAIDWKAELTCKETNEDIRYVGVRSHHIVPGCKNGNNTLQCRITKISRDVFFTSVILLPVNCDKKEDLSYIRMDLPNSDTRPISEGQLITVSIGEEDIIPLTA